MKTLTEKYIGTGEEHFLDILGRIISLEIRRLNPNNRGMITKWACDPGGEHWLVDADAQHHMHNMELFETGLEFTEDQGVRIVNNDPWLNALGEEYRWKVVIDGT